MCMSGCPNPTGAQCHCPSCHHTFNNVDAFDGHRDRGACLTPAPPRRGGTLAPAPQGGTTGRRIPAGRTLNGRRLPA